MPNKLTREMLLSFPQSSTPDRANDLKKRIFTLEEIKNLTNQQQTSIIETIFTELYLKEKVIDDKTTNSINKTIEEDIKKFTEENKKIKTHWSSLIGEMQKDIIEDIILKDALTNGTFTDIDPESMFKLNGSILIDNAIKKDAIAKKISELSKSQKDVIVTDAQKIVNAKSKDPLKEADLQIIINASITSDIERLAEQNKKREGFWGGLDSDKKKALTNKAILNVRPALNNDALIKNFKITGDSDFDLELVTVIDSYISLQENFNRLEIPESMEKILTDFCGVDKSFANSFTKQDLDLIRDKIRTLTIADPVKLKTNIQKFIFDIKKTKINSIISDFTLNTEYSLESEKSLLSVLGINEPNFISPNITTVSLEKLKNVKNLEELNSLREAFKEKLKSSEEKEMKSLKSTRAGGGIFVDSDFTSEFTSTPVSETAQRLSNDTNLKDHIKRNFAIYTKKGGMTFLTDDDVAKALKNGTELASNEKKLIKITLNDDNILDKNYTTEDAIKDFDKKARLNFLKIQHAKGLKNPTSDKSLKEFMLEKEGASLDREIARVKLDGVTTKPNEEQKKLIRAANNVVDKVSSSGLTLEQKNDIAKEEFANKHRTERFFNALGAPSRKLNSFINENIKSNAVKNFLAFTVGPVLRLATFNLISLDTHSKPPSSRGKEIALKVASTLFGALVIGGITAGISIATGGIAPLVLGCVAGATILLGAAREAYNLKKKWKDVKRHTGSDDSKLENAKEVERLQDKKLQFTNSIKKDSTPPVTVSTSKPANTASSSATPARTTIDNTVFTYNNRTYCIFDSKKSWTCLTNNGISLKSNPNVVEIMSGVKEVKIDNEVQKVIAFNELNSDLKKELERTKAMEEIFSNSKSGNIIK